QASPRDRHGGDARHRGADRPHPLPGRPPQPAAPGHHPGRRDPGRADPPGGRAGTDGRAQPGRVRGHLRGGWRPGHAGVPGRDDRRGGAPRRLVGAPAGHPGAARRGPVPGPAGPGLTTRRVGYLGPAELRLMQGLAQQVTAVRPELVNGDATVGELAWVWAKDFDALNRFWRHRLWFVDGQLAAWGWGYLPYRVPRSDGKLLEVKAANLIWQVHPDQPELLTGILDWYDEVAGDVDRLLTVQAADVQARAGVAAHGYAFDAETGSNDGSWVHFIVRRGAASPAQ